MITVGTTSSGKASILDNDGQNFTVVLDNFVGEFRIDSEVVYLHIILHGDCDVQSDIELSKNNPSNPADNEGRSLFISKPGIPADPKLSAL